MGGFVYPIILCPFIAYTVLGVSRLAWYPFIKRVYYVLTYQKKKKKKNSRCCVIFSNAVQVWTILDMHYLNICGSFHWHICHLCGSQNTEERMGLWYKPGDLVCWFILWLCHNYSSRVVYNSQIFLSPIWPCPAIMSIWLLPVYLHSCFGELSALNFPHDIL